MDHSGVPPEPLVNSTHASVSRREAFSQEFPLVALHVPADADLAAIK